MNPSTRCSLRAGVAAVAVAAAGLVAPPQLHAEAPSQASAVDEQQAKLQRRVVEALQSGDNVSLFLAMDEYRALEKVGATVPAGLYFAEADAARTQRDPVRADRAYGDYFRVAQREGEVFNEALRTYADWKNSIPESAWVILDTMVPVPGLAPPAGNTKGPKAGGETGMTPFSIGRGEVTRGQYGEFLKATGYRPKLPLAEGSGTPAVADDASCAMEDEDWTRASFEQTASDPVVCVSWDDARAYITWLNQSTGLELRLPTAREWDYAARAGATTTYWFGDVHESSMGNGPGAEGPDRWAAGTSPTGTFPANPFGLLDMAGNVAEWVSDCPTGKTGAAVTRGSSCSEPAIRGSSWRVESLDAASSDAEPVSPTYRAPDLGFRLATGS